MDSQLIVGIKDGKGRLILEQPYEDYVKGERNIAMSIYSYGQKLFNILNDELGYINLENNIFAFNSIFIRNVQETTMRLLGKIAEAIIVRRCNEDAEINKKWVKIARMGDRISKIADKYIAIGTGLVSTKNKYCAKYNPEDTQRDIKWINKDNSQLELMMVKRGNVDGNVAGLQSKVSIIGKRYIFNDLIVQRYEVPIVYFGINNDYNEIAYNLINSRKDIDIPKYFVDANSVDFYAFEELRSYIPLIKGLIEREIRPDELLNSNKLRNDNTLKSAIIATATEPFITKSICC